jgi:rare lipoprotein A
VKKGIKRSLTLMMFVAIPLVSANPTSALQEVTIPVTTVMQVPIAETVKVIEKVLPVKLGTASWYSQTDPYINPRTANNEIFDDTQMTCASWNYPFKTRLKITNLANGKSVIVVVNDRGPAKRLGRIVDLTRSAFARISSLNKGLVTVSVTPLD